MVINKKAFMRTMEAFMAVIITFSFVIVFLPRDLPTEDDQSVYLLQNIESNDQFRSCITSEDESCINQSINAIFLGRYDFTYSIFKTFEPEKNLKGKDVRTYSWFFAGNETVYEPKVFKLYYWSAEDDNS